MNSFVELNKCHVCGKEGNDDEIMLYDWFCDPCASKIGNQIESEVVQ